MQRRRAPVLLLTAGLAVALTACTPTGSLSMPSPSPRATASTPTPTLTPTATPTPTPSPTPPPAETPTAPTPTTEQIIARCVELAAPSFAGSKTGALTVHSEQAVIGTRPDGTIGVYIPVTDATPDLAEHEGALICALTADLTEAISYGGSLRLSDAEIAMVMDGTYPGGL